MNPSSRDLVKSLEQYRRILILIKGSPDPDAIASSFAMSAICAELGITASIVAEKKLSLQENRNFVSRLKIPLTYIPPEPDLNDFDAYIVTDSQSPLAPGITGKLPCAAFIDHHEPGGEDIEAGFMIQDTNVGSTSTIIALLLRDLGRDLDPGVMAAVSTALVYGIYTDTDKYSHAGTLDYEALDYLSKYSDAGLFTTISSTHLSKTTLQLLKKAITHGEIHKNWLITGVGYVDAEHRDSIAIIADFLIRREKTEAVVVFAIIEDPKRNRIALDASLRSSREQIDLNEIIRGITPEGGARKFKGAYQIQLDYFRHCPDRGLLWKLVEITTVDLLKRSRDELYITELKGFYRKFRKRVRDFFGG